MAVVFLVLVAAGALTVALDQHMKLTWLREQYMEELVRQRLEELGYLERLHDAD